MIKSINLRIMPHDTSLKPWGPQTDAAIRHFAIGNETMPHDIIKAIAIIKKAAAKINYKLTYLSNAQKDAIISIADRIISGELQQYFPISIWQSGSGTQTNMNVNEVIANFSTVFLHPNDHVNMGQSSNDTFPTAMNIASVIAIEDRLLPALNNINQAIERKAQEFSAIIKIGRTHMQDAVPMMLGQEFSAYNTQIENSINNIKFLLNNIKSIPQGGTAIGTGLNTSADFGKAIADEISHITSKNFVTANNKFAEISSNNNITSLSGELATLASSLHKLSSDIRFLASGPRSGIGELILPANEPGSSIMPGKINPTQCEAMNMICAQVIGNHNTIIFCNSQGHLQLNTYRPVMIYNFLQSINILSDGCNSLTQHCINGIKVNHTRISEMLQNSLMLVTGLNKAIGYDEAAKIANYSYDHNLTLKEAALQLNIIPDIITEKQFHALTDPHNMV